MQKINDLLQRFAKLTQTSDDTKNIIIESLESVGIKFTDIQKISVNKNIVTLKLNPSQKSEVFLKQKKIIEVLSKNPLTKNITIVR